MDAFNLRRIHEDFTIGFRVWQVDEFSAGDFEADKGQALTVWTRLEEIGPLDRGDQLLQTPNDAVMIQ